MKVGPSDIELPAFSSGLKQNTRQWVCRTEVSAEPVKYLDLPVERIPRIVAGSSCIAPASFTSNEAEGLAFV